MNIVKFKVGDIVNYRFFTKQGGLCSAIVQILELSNSPYDARPIANVRFIRSLADHSGNHLFGYLAHTNGTMWASQECLHSVFGR